MNVLFGEKEFELLKQSFVDKMTLAYSNPDKEYILNTDSSGFAISGILSQKDDNGVEKVILCVSRTLKAAELNYFITEKEMLAVVWCLQKLKTYLLGAKIKVYTDHQAITISDRCRFANNRIMRWILSIQDFDITYEYIEGKNNVAADVLSRNICDYNASKKIEEIFVGSIVKKSTVEKLTDISKIQLQDAVLVNIIENINNNDRNA